MRSFVRDIPPLIAFALATATASAHTMRPVAREIGVAPGDPARVVVFTEAAGILASRDSGRSFDFVCSQSYAVDPYAQGVPEAAVLDGGGIAVAARAAGLRVTRDDGCQFDRPPEFDGKDVVDVATPDGKDLYVLATERFDALAVTTILRSTDGGASFAPSGAPDTDAVASDLLVGDGGGSFYVLERDSQSAEARLQRSTDGGKTFKALSIPWSGTDATGRLAGIWSKDARVFFLTTNRALSPIDAEHALYFTADGGESFARLTAGDGRIVGPAFSPDGSRVAYGGLSGIVQADVAELVAEGSSAFHSVSSEAALALAWDAGGLLVGTSLSILGRVPLGGADAGGIRTVLDVCGLVPKTCASGTTATQCGSAPHVTAELAALAICRGPSDAGPPGEEPMTTPPPPPGPSLDAGPRGADAGPAVPRPDSGCSMGKGREAAELTALFLAGALSTIAFRRGATGRRRSHI